MLQLSLRSQYPGPELLLLLLLMMQLQHHIFIITCSLLFSPGLLEK